MGMCATKDEDPTATKEEGYDMAVVPRPKCHEEGEVWNEDGDDESLMELCGVTKQMIEDAYRDHLYPIIPGSDPKRWICAHYSPFTLDKVLPKDFVFVVPDPVNAPMKKFLSQNAAVEKLFREPMQEMAQTEQFAAIAGGRSEDMELITKLLLDSCGMSADYHPMSNIVQKQIQEQAVHFSGRITEKWEGDSRVKGFNHAIEAAAAIAKGNFMAKVKAMMLTKEIWWKSNDKQTGAEAGPTFGPRLTASMSDADYEEAVKEIFHEIASENKKRGNGASVVGAKEKMKMREATSGDFPPASIPTSHFLHLYVELMANCSPLDQVAEKRDQIAAVMKAQPAEHWKDMGLETDLNHDSFLQFDEVWSFMKDQKSRLRPM